MRSHKIVEIFLQLCLLMEDLDPYLDPAPEPDLYKTITDPDPELPKKHTDPDLQYCAGSLSMSDLLLSPGYTYTSIHT